MNPMLVYVAICGVIFGAATFIIEEYHGGFLLQRRVEQREINSSEGFRDRKES